MRKRMKAFNENIVLKILFAFFTYCHFTFLVSANKTSRNVFPAWNVTTYTLENAFKINSREYNKSILFTLIDEKNVRKNSKEFLSFYGNSIFNLKQFRSGDFFDLNLTPSRAAFHEIILAVSTQLQLESEIEMQNMVKKVYSELFVDIKKVEQEILETQELAEFYITGLPLFGYSRCFNSILTRSYSNYRK